MFDFCDSCQAIHKDEEVEYEEQEQSITELLHIAAGLVLGQGISIFSEKVRHTISSMSDLNSGLLAMSPVMSTVQSDSVDVSYKDMVDKAIYRGSKESGAGDYIKYALRKEEVKNGIVNSSKYYSNKFFNEQVIPKIQNFTEKALEGGMSSRVLFDEVRKEIDDHFGSVRYWKLVANNSASRAFQYGLCKGGVYSGYSIVRYDAVMDNRTSQICRRLNGTTWSIHEALEKLEEVALAAPSEIKEISPWITDKQQKEWSDADLAAQGVICPPSHALCRSVLTLA